MQRYSHIGRVFVRLLICCVALSGASSRADELYAITGPQAPYLLKVDAISGTVLSTTPLPPGVALRGLCADGSGLLSIEGLNDNISDRLYRIAPLTGVGTALGNTLFNWNFRSCGIHRPTNTLYAITDTPGPTPRLYRIDKSTGAATLVAICTFVPGLDQVTAMAISPSGVAYVSDVVGTGLFRLDLGSGALTFIGDAGPSGFSGGFSAMSFDSDGQLWGVRSTGGLHRVNTETAVATHVASSIRWVGMAFMPEAVVATDRTTWARLKGRYR